MKNLEIIGFKRANLDSASLSELRESGNVPCVVYGPGIKEQIHFYSPIILFRDLIYTPEVHMVELNIEGTIIKAVLKDAQFHPVSETLLHADFVAFAEDKPILNPVYEPGPIDTEIACKSVSFKLASFKIKY